MIGVEMFATYQRIDTVSTDDSNYYSSDRSKYQTAVFEGQWHGQYSRTQAAFE